MRWMQSVQRGSAAAVLCLLAAMPMAAPVVTTDETDTLGSLNDPAQLGGRLPAAPTGAPRTPDRPLGVETTTGNKNLDLLLELQGKPGGEPRQAAPRSAAAASAAAAALAALRAKAAERPPQDAGQAKPVPQPFEGMGTVEGEARAPQPTERRQWSGQLSGGGGGGTGYVGAPGESSAAPSGFDDDNLLRKLPRELVVFLRENRYWLLAVLGGLAVVGAAVKSYSRRI